MGKTFGILSIKGGVGKTTTAIALGDAISSFGKKVLLIDSNLSMPNLGVHLKILDSEKSLHNVLNRTANTNEAIHNLENFDVLPSSIFTTTKINPFDLKSKIRGLKRRYDFIIIDSSPALNEETLATMLASDEIFIVTTPDYPTLTATLKAAKLANQKDNQINGLILNKVHNKNFELSIEDIEKTVEIPVMAVIPHDVDVLKSLSEFKPLTSHKPNSKASIEYKKLAGVLVGQKYKPFNLKNFFKFTPKKQEINRELFYNRVFK
tara:strand:- start:3238 stop:4029 length:792 start_codon:yes stop_codon:yes gene_type:complete